MWVWLTNFSTGTAFPMRLFRFNVVILSPLHLERPKSIDIKPKGQKYFCPNISVLFYKRSRVTCSLFPNTTCWVVSTSKGHINIHLHSYCHLRLSPFIAIDGSVSVCNCPCSVLLIPWSARIFYYLWLFSGVCLGAYTAPSCYSWAHHPAMFQFCFHLALYWLVPLLHKPVLDLLCSKRHSLYYHLQHSFSLLVPRSLCPILFDNSPKTSEFSILMIPIVFIVATSLSFTLMSALFSITEPLTNPMSINAHMGYIQVEPVL